jgi:alpha-galactosidase
MLLAGNDCVTDLEAQTQMAIWSMVAAPLIMGNDLRNVSESMRALLLNDEIIAIDQDPLGKAGGRAETSGGVEVWTRDLAGGSLAIAVYFETGDLTATVDFAALGWGTGDAKVRDVLRRADLGVLRGRVAVVAPGDHATRLLKLERP